MTNDSTTPLLDDDGKLRMHRFIIATIASALVIAAGVAVGMHSADPDGGWNVAFGIGAMIGFWMCPLAGALIGNGYHEIMKERAEAQAETIAIASGDVHPVAA
jgi:divalent metal cation (Fe/Co/Zn/Cd) transporter